MSKGTYAKVRAMQWLSDLRADPCLFAQRVCGFAPSEQQAPILRALAEPGSHISVRSGHGTGKTGMLAIGILWFLSLFPDDTKIPCTAPSAHQLFDNLWAEAAKWKQRMIPSFRDRLVVMSDRIQVNGMEQTCFAVARTSRADKPEALQGFHARNLLVIVDEASGVDDAVFQVSEGTLTTPGARIWMTGNPTRTDGYFHRSHNADRAAWKTFCLSSEASPWVEPGYAARMAERYGRDSDIYRVRVLGEFPRGGADTLIPLDWVESAIGRDIRADGARIAGLDVSRFGDDQTAFLVRHGQRVTHIDQWQHKDTMITTGKVVGKKRRENLYDRVHVDSIGVGAGVVDRLKELGMPVMGVNVGEASPGRHEFMRLRDELWWRVREWFESRNCAIDPAIPRDLLDVLVGELSAIRYTYSSNGKIKVQGKREFKEDGLVVFEGLARSPNIADALCLTFAEGQLLAGRSAAASRPVQVEQYPW